MPTSVAGRSAAYAALDAALRQRQPDSGRCPRFFGAAHRVTQRLGVGWVDLSLGGPRQRALALVVEQSARWAGYLPGDCQRAVAGPAARLLLELNAHLWAFNLDFMQRLSHGRLQLFHPMTGAQLHCLTGLSPGLSFDLWMVVREQLEIEAWLQQRGVAPDSDIDQLITGWEHARRDLARGEIIKRLGLRRTALIQHLIQVDLLLRAVQRRLPAATVRFTAFDWRTAIGCAHVFALHRGACAPGFIDALEALTSAGAPLSLNSVTTSVYF